MLKKIEHINMHAEEELIYKYKLRATAAISWNV